MARIFCFGDSITYGESDTGSGGWVELLKRFYLNQDPKGLPQKTLVYNLGIASETVDGLEQRFSNELASRISSKADNVVVLSYGINDLTKITDRFGKNKNRVPLDYFVNKLQSCIELALDKNIRVIVTTILPFASQDDGLENIYHEVRFAKDVDLYNQAIKLMSDSTGCTLLDLNLEFLNQQREQLLAGDGLHPNEKGHQLIFNRVKDVLDALVV